MQLEVALAHRSVEEAAALQLLPGAAWVDPAARGLYPNRADALRAYWAEATPWVRRGCGAAGADVSSRMDAAIAFADGGYHGQKLYGDLLLFAPDRAAEVLERARDRPLAMALAAARLHPAPRARELLAAAVDAGHAPTRSTCCRHTPTSSSAPSRWPRRTPRSGGLRGASSCCGRRTPRGDRTRLLRDQIAANSGERRWVWVTT